jgi:tripartite ATP-independent transporter DctP family solute receptor
MKKGTFRFTLICLVLLCASLFLVVQNSNAARQLKLASFTVSGSPWHLAMLKFAEIVKDKTNGEIEVLVYPDAQLGDMTQTLNNMRIGSIDMAYFDVGVGSFMKEYKAMQIVWCPYLFKSKLAARRVMNSKMIYDYIDAATKKSGVRIFAIAGDRSPRAVQTVRGPIMKPEDLKGMKLRMPGLDIFIETAKAWGAKPTVLGMSEIYMALKQGVVEGQDNGFDLSIPPKFHEIAKYWSATDHVYSITGWYIGEKVWTSLTEEQRKIFSQAAEEAGQLATDEVEKLDQHGIEILKKAGCTYVVPDREAFQKATAYVPDQFDGKIWPAGWVQKIKEMQENF